MFKTRQSMLSISDDAERLAHVKRKKRRVSPCLKQKGATAMRAMTFQTATAKTVLEPVRAH